MTELKYFIVDSQDKDKVNWNTVVETGIDRCRWNKSRTQFIVKSKTFQKWHLNKPIYTLSAIKEIMNRQDW